VHIQRRVDILHPVQGPFVMNTPDKIRQATAHFKGGRFGQMAHG
jgi:redox-sensitive bicupin YhaK (pirin superfamily)